MHSMYPSFPVTNHIGGDDICGRHKTNDYSSSDRIIIYGILSQIGAELALALAEGCGVRHIFGLSDHLLDTEESARLEFLIRRIPDLGIVIIAGRWKVLIWRCKFILNSSHEVMCSARW